MDTPTEAELAALRAELTESRADVQRFEAQLDAANCELAQARAATDNARASGHEAAKSALDHYAMEKRNARTWEERALKAEAELAQARAERDEAVRRRDFAKDGEDNMRFLKVLWENECGFYRAQSVARLHEIDLGRRTIRALVVAARALRQTAWNWRMDGMTVRDVVLDVRARVGHINKQSGQQAGE